MCGGVIQDGRRSGGVMPVLNVLLKWQCSDQHPRINRRFDAGYYRRTRIRPMIFAAIRIACYVVTILTSFPGTTIMRPIW